MQDQAVEPGACQIFVQMVAAISPGRVATYGQIAGMAGYPGYARLVGITLKNLPADSRIPWHRVVNAQGYIAFPAGSEGFERQQTLLEKEGVTVVGGRVSLRRFGWNP